MLLAVNHSPQAAALITVGAVPLDIWKRFTNSDGAALTGDILLRRS